MGGNKKPYYILGILVFVLGLGIEGIKNFAVNSHSSAEFKKQSFDLGHFELRPFHQKASLQEESESKSQQFRKSLQKGIRVKGLGRPLDLKKAHTFKKVKKKKKDKKKQAKKDKKKKKKKKEVKVAEEDSEYRKLQNSQPIDPAQSKDASASDDNSYVGGGFVATTGPQNINDTSLPLDAQEWIDYILNSPSLTKVTKMIDYYQTNLLSAEVFYAVVNVMLEDTRDELRDFAILALGSTPSTTSFKLLVDINGSNVFNGFLKSKAASRLTNYQSPSRFNVLHGVMGMGSNNLNYVSAAVKELRWSTEKYISSRDPSDTSSREMPKYQSRLFKGFTQVLENIIKENPNSGELTSNAQAALEKIKSIPSEEQIN